MIKQHITVEQLKEIPSEKLIPLIKDKLIKVGESDLIRTRKTAHQFTIGKMIEILSKEFGYFTITKNKFVPEGVFWQVEANPDFSFEKYELFDALWEVVKEVLC